MNPHQWSLAKNVVQKFKSDAKKGQIKVKPKRDGVKTQQNYNSSQFSRGKFDALKTLRINGSRP